MSRDHHRPLRTAASAVLAAALLSAGTSAPANAQIGGLSPEQIVNAGRDALGTVTPESLSQVLASTGSPAFAGSTMMGSADRLGFSPNMFAGTSPLPPAPDPSITSTRVVGVTVDGRYERWQIASARMQRIVTVEVYRARDRSVAAPSLYLLDGVGSELPSGFMQWGARDQFADEQVNLVIPTGGQASMWADWNESDPVLGINKWETFITRDLPALIEPALGSNGRRGIGGISMGAAAAVSIATRHPEMYQGVFGVSGCYTTAKLGEILTRYTVESRGATLADMWGAPDGPQWRDHDVLDHAEALRGKAVYVSAANGVATPGDWDAYRHDAANFVAGMALEQASNQCTYQLDARLSELGIPARIDHLPTGLHNWSYFAPQIPIAWRSIRSALA